MKPRTRASSPHSDNTTFIDTKSARFDAPARTFRAGFTLIEISIAVGLFLILISLATMNITGLIPRTNITTTAEVLVADMKQQQLKSFVGEVDESGVAAPHGVYFTNNAYILFSGSSYDNGDPTQVEIALPATVRLDSFSFPDNQLVFERVSGEVAGLSDGVYSLRVLDTVTNQERSVSLTRYGIIEVQ